MKIINWMLISYFIVALPLLFVMLTIWPDFARSELATGSDFLTWGNAITGFLSSVWIISALYIALSLAVSRRFREQLLKRFVHMQERDEREEMIVGKAARNAFLFNLALLIMLLLLNLIQVQVTRLAPDHMMAGKEHTLFLGLNASPIRQAPQKQIPLVQKGDKVLFQYDFPITVSGVLMMLIILNIGAFYFYARKKE